MIEHRSFEHNHPTREIRPANSGCPACEAYWKLQDDSHWQTLDSTQKEPDMPETKSIIINVRVTPSEHKELEARFGTPGKALRYSVDTIMADRKVRMPDAQFLVFPNAMVEVDSIVTAQQLEGGLVNPGQNYTPKVRVQLHSGHFVDVHATYDQFLTELAKARMAN